MIAMTINGAGPVRDIDDAMVRLSLLDPDLGLRAELAQFKTRAAQFLTPTVMRPRVDKGVTPAALQCIRWFAVGEADVTSPGLKGLGRVSEYGFPRLGGTLFRKVAAGSGEAALVQAAVERTIHAAYLAVLTTEKGPSAAITIADANVLWNTFIPVSYSVPQHLGDIAMDICGFDQFWLAVLNKCGLEKDAKRWMKGKPSPIGQSIGGLCSVGVALSLAERGMAKP